MKYLSGDHGVLLCALWHVQSHGCGEKLGRSKACGAARSLIELGCPALRMETGRIGELAGVCARFRQPVEDLIQHIVREIRLERDNRSWPGSESACGEVDAVYERAVELDVALARVGAREMVSDRRAIDPGRRVALARAELALKASGCEPVDIAVLIVDTKSHGGRPATRVTSRIRTNGGVFSRIRFRE